MARMRELVLVSSVACVSACAHAGTRETARARVAPNLTMARTSRPTHASHELLVEAASCWFGGLWGDVQGESPAERALEARKHCELLVRDVYGNDDRTRYEQVRALESVTVDEVATKVASLADADREDAPRKEALVNVTRALAETQRETMFARRAGHRIQRDVAREPEKLSSDEAAALPDLESAKAFDKLFHAEAGPLQREAHALALLVVLDRMNVAHELPLHLKPYPVVEPFHAVFDAPIPELPHDASKPLPRAGWLTYLTAVAARAGHPISQPDAPPQIRHEQAVGGILAGIETQLRADAQGIDAPLQRIVQYVIRDLDAVARPRGEAAEGPRAGAVRSPGWATAEIANGYLARSDRGPGYL